MFEKYRTYLRNNPQGFWFKRKLYGYGWTPATWQGWIATLIFIVLVVANFYRIDNVAHSASDTLTTFLPETALLTFLFFLLCVKKGESLRWQWGESKKEKKI